MPEDRIIEADSKAAVVTFVVKINNAEIPQTLKVETIIVTNEVNRVPTAKLVFVDGSASEEKFEASNGTYFVPGNEIEIAVGYDSTNETIFKGIIIKHNVKIRSSNAILTIECKDKIIKSTLGRKNKYFDANVKDSEVVTKILSTYGASTSIEATSVVHKQLMQYDATDWDFMLTRIEANNQLMYIENGKVNVKTPNLGGSPVITLVFGATLLEFDAEIDARHQMKTVRTHAWNSDDQKVTIEDAPDPNVSLNGNLTNSDLSKVLDLEEYTLKHGGAISGEELQNWGKAFWWKHQVAKVRGRARFKGTSKVKPLDILAISGVSDRINGNCFVSAIQHYISAGDWQTEAQLGISPDFFAKENEVMYKPAAGLLPGVNGLQVGKVTQLESDPDGQYRVKVYLPIVSPDEQGFWARIATLDAGKDRGTFFLPEIGDEVIVGFINDDPRDAVILGMMHSSAHPAPLTAADANPQKGIVTRSKMKMIFDDDKPSYTLETPAGKSFTIDDNAGIIKMEDENGNKIVMDAQGITIESKKAITMKATTDFKLEALSIDQKASTTFNAEGNASATVKASGTLTIKGALVQIN